MTIEQYFKDKINWKVFNSILDACIHLEDDNIWFSINISYLNTSMSDANKYRYIYRMYNVTAAGHEYKIMEDYSTEPLYNRTIESYEKFGLFFTIFIDSDIKDSTTIKKLKNNKNLVEIDADKRLPLRYVFKAV